MSTGIPQDMEPFVQRMDQHRWPGSRAAALAPATGTDVSTAAPSGVASVPCRYSDGGPPCASALVGNNRQMSSNREKQG